MEKKHPALNKISVVDKFRVKAYSFAQDVHYVFEAYGDRGNARAAFTCHVYDSAGHSHPAYVETDTLSTDGISGVRSHSTGRTLDELVHNIDWAHKPSELAWLRSLLSTRATTDAGQPIGDLVIRRLSDDQARLADECRADAAQALVQAQAQKLIKLVGAAVEEAAKDAYSAARFGLRKDIELNIGSVKP